MNAPLRITFRSLHVRPVHVPMRIPLQTSGGTMRIAPLALIDLHTNEGVTGRTYLFCYTPLVLKPVCELLANLEPILEGAPVAPLRSTAAARPVPPARRQGDRGHGARRGSTWLPGTRWRELRGSRWHAPSAPTCSSPRLQQLRAGPDRPRRCARRGGSAGASGFSAIKVRLGYADLDDRHQGRAGRCKAAIGDGVHLMSDYNQACRFRKRCNAFRHWPTKACTGSKSPACAHDYAGYARVRPRPRPPSRWARTGGGPTRWPQVSAVGASDLGMPDAMKIGGVTGWMQAAAIADSAGMPISTHLFPEVSVHLMAGHADPTLA